MSETVTAPVTTTAPPVPPVVVAPAEAVAPVVTTPVDPPKPPPEPRESRNVQANLKLLRDRATLDAERAKFAEQQKTWQAIEEARKSKDPLKVLQAAGVPADVQSEYLLNGGVAPNAKELEVENTLKETKEQITKLQAEQQKFIEQQQAAQIEQARQEAFSLIKGAAEKLPWINALGANEAVIAEVKAQHARGETPDFEKASLAVESRISGEMGGTLKKLVAVPSIRTMLETALKEGAAPIVEKPPIDPKAAPAPSDPTAPPANELAAALRKSTPANFQRRGTTLSNAMSASPTSTQLPARPKTPAQLWEQQQAKFRNGGA